ncbi:hypothetical protein EWM64_g10054, partial [Hericium alpestre]
MAANSVNEMSHIKSALKIKFEMTDLGEIHWLLGIEIKCD